MRGYIRKSNVYTSVFWAGNDGKQKSIVDSPNNYVDMARLNRVGIEIIPHKINRKRGEMIAYIIAGLKRISIRLEPLVFSMPSVLNGSVYHPKHGWSG